MVEVGIQKVLYEREFSAREDYVHLPSEGKISTKFNLFDWYDFPKTGKFLIQICYQGDENVAYKPDSICKGIFCSEKKTIIFE